MREELTGLGFTIKSIELGEVILNEQVSQKDADKLRQVLADNDFELIDDKKSWIINRIKTLIIEYIHHEKHMRDLFLEIA